MKKYRFENWALMAALGLAVAAPASAQDAEVSGRIGNTQGKAAVDVDVNRTPSGRPNVNVESDANTSTNIRRSSVMEVNKASKLVGMTVRNLSNETLGTIEDLVVDMQTGKISYAVLGVGGFLGVGERYIAVPPSAFKVGADQESLVLNADRARLESVPGFVKTNWPDVQNPNVGSSPLWSTDTDASVGGSVGGTTGVGRDSNAQPQPQQKAPIIDNRDPNRSTTPGVRPQDQRQTDRQN